MQVVQLSALPIGASLALVSVNFLAAQTEPPPSAAQFLFVQTAKHVAFKDGVLTLQDVSPSSRIVLVESSGQVRNHLFLKQWTDGKNSFKSDPPNAFLTVFNEKTRPAGAIIALSNPRSTGNSLQYDARILKGTPPANGIESTLITLSMVVRRAIRSLTPATQAIPAGRNKLLPRLRAANVIEVGVALRPRFASTE